MRAAEVDLIDDITGEVMHFESIRAASIWLGRANSYLQAIMKEGKGFVLSSKAKSYTYKVRSKNYPNKNGVRKEKRKPAQRPDSVQLCSYCGRCNKNDCVFINSRGNLPVPGWDAKPTSIRCGPIDDPTWIIRKCPNFYPDSAIIKGRAEMTAYDWRSLGDYADWIKGLQEEYQNRMVEDGQR